MIKDFGIKNYIHVSRDLPHSEPQPWRLVCTMPYNCHFQPRIQVQAHDGNELRLNSTNPLVGFLTPTESIATSEGEHTYEAKNWISGEGAIYTIPANVTVKAVQYHETGYDTDFEGSFECNDEDYNVLWKKGARTAYICMREWFYDCPDRERVGFWGDGTPELNQCFYAFDEKSHELCRDLVRRKLEPGFYPGQHLEFLGDYGIWFYYMHTGDLESLRAIYDQTRDFVLETYQLNNPRTWYDWGSDVIDTEVIENCFYYIALKTLRKMATLTGHEADIEHIDQKMESIRGTFDSKYWNGSAYMSKQVLAADDRANAMAINSGLANPSNWNAIYENVLTQRFNASNFFDRWVFEALCKIGQEEYALLRMYRRYRSMISCSFTTLFEQYDRWWGRRDAFDQGSSLNHGWNPPVINLSQTIAGISPEEPGWTTYQVLPKEAFLTSIAVVVPSIKGTVSVNLRKTAIDYSLNLISPPGTSAIVGIPKRSFSKLDSIAVQDETIWNEATCGEVEGVSWDSEDEDYIKFKVAPGAWSFKAFGELPLTTPKPNTPSAPSDGIKLDRRGWKASASVDGMSFELGKGNSIDVSAANAIDGDYWTGWRDLSKKQHPGQWFQVDMGECETFDRIVLENTWAMWEAPDRYAVTVSNDGRTWSDPIATGTGELGRTTITFPEQHARFIRITQTGMSILYHWSIYEFEVYQGCSLLASEDEDLKAACGLRRD